MRFYDEVVFPRILDVAMRGDEINALRHKTLAGARGRVLEVGFGTGLNARHYPKDVEELVVVDNNAGMSRKALERLAQAGVTAHHEVQSGEALPFAAARFDTVVVTFTLCSIPDVDGALAEMRRVLAPGGRLLFLEHNLADDPRDQRWQRRLTPVWGAFAGGCHLDRDAPALIERSGFRLVELEKTRLTTSPALFGTIRRGVAE